MEIFLKKPVWQKKLGIHTDSFLFCECQKFDRSDGWRSFLEERLLHRVVKVQTSTGEAGTAFGSGGRQSRAADAVGHPRAGRQQRLAARRHAVAAQAGRGGGRLDRHRQLDDPRDSGGRSARTRGHAPAARRVPAAHQGLGVAVLGRLAPVQIL